MKIQHLLESSGATYYTVCQGTQEAINTIPEDRCWIDNAESISAMSIYLQDFTSFGKAIQSGDCSLYQFFAPKPTPLPINVTLNYVSIGNATRLPPDDLKDSIKWLRSIELSLGQDLSEIIVNSAYEKHQWTKGRATHQELVGVLSDIVKSIGDMVWNPQDGDPTMRYQVIATVPVEMHKISLSSMLDRDARFDTTQTTPGGGRIVGIKDQSDQDDSDDSDDADWWKK